MKDHPVIAKANERAVNLVGGFAAAAASIDRDQLCRWYKAEMDAAPLRAAKWQKPYFVVHSGQQGKEHFGDGSEGRGEGRKEEHLAVALFNEFDQSKDGLQYGPDESIRILDYQFPLKAKAYDGPIGKVDILAQTQCDRLAVVELKYMPVGCSASRSDTPLRAFIEGLAYCAILQADLENPCQQAEDKFHRPFEKSPPSLIVLANDEYWETYRECKAAGPWKAELQRLAAVVEQHLAIPVLFLSLSIPDMPVKYEDKLPKFTHPPAMARVW